MEQSLAQGAQPDKETKDSDEGRCRPELNSVLGCRDGKHDVQDRQELFVVYRFGQQMMGMERFGFEQRVESIASMDGSECEDLCLRCAEESVLDIRHGLVRHDIERDDGQFNMVFAHAAEKVIQILRLNEALVGIRDGVLNGRTVSRIVIEQQYGGHDRYAYSYHGVLAEEPG